MTKPNKKIKEREQVYKILKLNDATNKASWWNIADDVCELFSTDKPINKDWEERDWEDDLDDYIEATHGKITFDEVRLFIFKALKKEKKELKEKIEKIKVKNDKFGLPYGEAHERAYNQAIDDILKRL